jgi:3-(3-hydroxy-phenyl)propionate hydroxylase
MESFHPLRRVFFAGDAAHQVSPFGARGANSGVQDTDNLCWKLSLVLDGKAPEQLLATYDEERVPAADENILNSTRSTDFITPKNTASRAFRDATLELSRDFPFARRMVNSGRLSLPHVYAASPLNTPDGDAFQGRMVPGAPCTDAPIGVDGASGWLLDQLGGEFVGLYFEDDGGVSGEAARELAALAADDVPVRPVVVGAAPDEPSGVTCIADAEGLVAQRYDAKPGTFYLIRPDQHVAARWRSLSVDAVRRARARAIAREA